MGGCSSFKRGAAVLLAVGLLGCPGGGATPDPEPPPFRAADADPLAEPPPPAADKEGLAYLKQIYPSFRDRWRAFVNDCRLRLPAGDPLNDSSLAARVRLSVDAEGALVNAALTEPSGNADFDGAALEIARDAAPLPTPPAALLSDDGKLHLSWGFHRDNKLAGLATAEVERVRYPPEKAIAAFLAAGAIDRAAARLEEEASAGDPSQLVAAADQLAVGAIRAALTADDEAVRAAGVAAARLAGRSAPLAPELAAVARGAVDESLRRDAVAALGELGAKDARPLIEELLGGGKGGSPAVAAAAVAALDRLGAGAEARAALAEALASDDEARVQLAVAVAVEVPLPEARARLAELVSKGDRGLRGAACTAFGRAAAAGGDKAAAFKLMRGQLDSRDAGLRAGCARGIAALARAGGTSRLTFWKVVDLLKHRDERVRAAATRAGAALEPTRFPRELYRLKREKSPVVLAALATALSALPGKVALDRLIELAGAEAVPVRLAAARGLAARPEPEARAKLAEMITDPEVEVRLAALPVVEIDAVEPLTRDEAAELRLAALGRWFGGEQRGQRVLDFARRMVAADDPAERARLAGGWLAR